MTRRFIGFALVAGVVLAACTPEDAAAGAPHAWIDAPLDGMRLSLDPYRIVLHGSAAQGISRMEVSVNGEPLTTLENPAPDQLLVYLTQDWEPEKPGRYVIRVRAQNFAGAWSEEDVVVVEVGEASPTPTLISTITPTPTITSTPTVTPTATGTPGSGGPFGQPELSSSGFYYGGGCSPSEVTVRLQAAQPTDVSVLVFFHRLKDIQSGETTDWSDGQAMNPAGGGFYELTLNGNAIGPDGGSDEALVLYQFVAQLKDGTRVRTPVFSNLQLGRCGAMRPVPTTPAGPSILSP